MRDVLELVRMVCDTPVNVLIQGENGTGKEVIARMTHAGRDPSECPFVPVNCAAIPENLMESEFFGYEKVHLPVRYHAAKDVSKRLRIAHCFSTKLAISR
jgi:DNA-binding NtrC family response regulator